jgi:hypothetical protein
MQAGIRIWLVGRHIIGWSYFHICRIAAPVKIDI